MRALFLVPSSIVSPLEQRISGARFKPQSHFCPIDFFGVDGYLRVRARYPSGKGEVCKTFMRRFDSDPRLQIP